VHAFLTRAQVRGYDGMLLTVAVLSGAAVGLVFVGVR
jgi:hypothetical protein